LVLGWVGKTPLPMRARWHIHYSKDRWLRSAQWAQRAHLTTNRCCSLCTRATHIVEAAEQARPQGKAAREQAQEAMRIRDELAKVSGDEQDFRFFHTLEPRIHKYKEGKTWAKPEGGGPREDIPHYILLPPRWTHLQPHAGEPPPNSQERLRCNRCAKGG
jgi:hypothetical protein